MFGSLVIVYPTPHEGGELVLRHEGKEWTFDSARITAKQREPSLAYIAFYSDVEHEVLDVKSGYRVTVTYNLYRASDLSFHPSSDFRTKPQCCFAASPGGSLVSPPWWTPWLQPQSPLPYQPE